MNKFKKILATGLATIVLGTPIVYSKISRNMQSHRNAQVLCGGYLYTKDGDIFGFYDAYAPREKADQIMKSQKEAGKIASQYGLGSKELRQYLANHPEITSNFE